METEKRQRVSFVTAVHTVKANNTVEGRGAIITLTKQNKKFLLEGK